MIIELTRDTAVRLSKGTVIEVSDDEGKRLIAFNNAKKAKKETKKKK